MKRLLAKFGEVVATGLLLSGAIFGQVPSIATISPNVRTANAPGNFTVMATGTNFCVDGFGTVPIPNDAINFNGTANTATTPNTTMSSATILTTEVPAVVAPTNVPVTISTTSACGSQTSASVNFLINPPLLVGPPSLPGGAVASPYSASILAAGGTPPYGVPNFSTAPSPPPGATSGPGAFNINFTPIPSQAATYAFQLTFTDNGGGNTMSPAYVFTIRQPNSLSASAGNNQAATVGTAFPILMQALVLDPTGLPVQGAAVTFTAPGSGASGIFPGVVTQITVPTDVNGHATAPPFLANTIAGAYAVTASVPTGINAPLMANFNLTNNAGAAVSLSATQGTPQSTRVNSPFFTQLQATVKDTFGNGVPNVNVTFAAQVAASGATATFGGPTTVMTGAGGVAMAPSVIANTKVGGYNVTASAAGLTTVNFSLMNTPGFPNSLVPTAGTPQSTPVNTNFPVNLQVMVVDQFGNPVGAGVPVSFFIPILQGSPGPSGTFGGNQNSNVLSNAAGLATAGVLTANTIPGNWTVFVNSSQLDTSDLPMPVTNLAGPPATITATAGTPQSATVNTAFGTMLQATVVDSFGNPTPGVTVNFVAPGSGASGTFSGSSSVTTNSSGVATASTFTANTKAGSYNVNATSGSAPPAPFSLTNNPGAPALLTATAGSPEAAIVNTNFPINLQATVTDSFGNGLSGYQVTFTPPAATTPATAGASFVGTSGSVMATTNAAGQATAPILAANSITGSYQVQAASGSVSGTPTPFNLTNTAGAAAKITATSGTPQSALLLTSFGSALQATVFDAFNNLAPNVVVTFTLPNNPPGASTQPGAEFQTPQGYQLTVTATTNASGVATSPIPIANTLAGNYNAQATVPGVAAPALFALSNTVSTNGSAPPPPPTSLTITTPSLPPGTVGMAYSGGVAAANGTPPYSFFISGGSLPAGLSFNSGGGISGVPTAPGTQSVTVQVNDSAGASASRGYTITIAPALLITTGSPLPNAVVGQSYAVTFTATGGQPAYNWSIIGGAAGFASEPGKEHLAGGLPPGLNFVSGPTTATLSGSPTTPGDYSFTVVVSDSQQRQAFKAFSLTEAPAGGGGPTTPGGHGPPGIQISQTNLNFGGPMNGNPPPPQYISVVATNQAPLMATIQTDSGSNGTPPPSWLTARFVSAITPARLAILTNQAGLSAGTHTGRVLVTYQGQQTMILNVSIDVNLTPPKLEVDPGFLRFAAIVGTIKPQLQALLVSNTGTGGNLNFTATVAKNPPWIKVSPASGSTIVGSGVPVTVTVDPTGLAIGSYLTTIHFDGGAGGSVDVPVSLFISPDGPIMVVTPNGERFDARTNNGLTAAQQIIVLNAGSGTVNWAADLMAGGNVFSLSPASGQSTGGAFSSLQVTANPQGLPPGPVYGLLRFTDPNALNSPQYAVLLLNVQPSSTDADGILSPSGLYFTATAGGTAPASQKMKVYVSSDTPATYQAAASSDDGANWLSIDSNTGTASTQNPATITVSVNPAGLKPGVYTGDVSVSFSNQTIRTGNITLVVQSAGTTGIANDKERAAGCAPSRLSLTSTSLVNAFTSPAGWPTPLIVRVTDDCGAAATGAQVVATFSNGDPPLAMTMTDSTAATFSGTWAPGNTAPQMTVTVSGIAPGLAAGSARLTGTIGGNTAPALSANSAVNNLNPAPGAALAPGTVAQIYGGTLSPSTTQPGLLPLPTLFNGTSVLIGAYLAPLYYLSDGQLNIQIPAELTPNRQYSILVSSGAAFTLPDTIAVTDVSPGLLNFAQHADFTTVTPGSPATAGETVLLYLVGMGATSPAVASGAAAPGAPFANVTTTPSVTVNGETASVGFAGLTPGLVGLYQINVQLPADTASGAANVAVTQGSATSNTVTIPVQ